MRTRFMLICIAAISLGACATSPGYYNRYDGGYAGACANCGTIEKIERVYGEREATGGGAVLGAIIGGALGNQVGKGDGRKAATIAGAVAGGVIGNQVEKDSRSAPRFEIFVQMDDGRRLVVEQPYLNDLRDGDRVELVGQQLRLL
ncbi:MAG: glycine zipper 2TM domain-containing protein [Lysobacterales bacterium]|nr:glycine zipper 2TM domain-containing protein [Rhodanobacteraceae bacterium]